MHVSACLRDGYSLLFVVLSASCIMYGKEQSCTNKHWKACSTTNATKESLSSVTTSTSTKHTTPFNLSLRT
jgi:hypothetical protein